MADITKPPVLIDTDIATESGQGAILFRNPYYSGPYKSASTGFLYVVLRGSNVPRTVNVFRSVDLGKTWARMDAANSPAISLAAGQIRMQAKLDPDGVNITIAFNPTGASNPATLSFVKFDTTAGQDVFVAGVIPDVVSVGSAPGLLSFDMEVRVNGDIVLAYPLIVAPNVSETDMGYQLYSAAGGTWGAFVSLVAGDDATQVGWQRPALVLDASTGLLHWFMTRIQLVLAQSFEDDWYMQLSGADVATVPVQLSTRGANFRPSYGRPWLWNGGVAFPVYTYAGGGGSFTFGVWIGTPAATPVFAFTELDSGGSLALQFDIESGQLVVDGTDLWAIWIFQPDQNTIELRRSINDGTGWGALEVFWDAITNPPSTNPAASQRIFVATGGQTASLGVVVMARNDIGDGVSYFLIGPRCEVGIMSGLGVKIKDWSGKYYMNDYVPAELIFGFDNAQTPGFPYPEIYIPKDQALYLDLAPFLNSPVNGLLTLCFKGMKVYGEQ